MQYNDSERRMILTRCLFVFAVRNRVKSQAAICSFRNIMSKGHSDVRNGRLTQFQTRN